MTTKFQRYYKHPRYKISVVSPSDDNIPVRKNNMSSWDDDIPSKKNNIPSWNDNIPSNNDIIAQSDVNLISSSPKSKISLWPNILWIGLGILIFIALVIVVVGPIIALANKGELTTTTATISTICPTTEITSTITIRPLPAQCSSYTNISDSTRSPDYLGYSGSDYPAYFTSPLLWIRFVPPGGTLLASCPIDIDRCGAEAPGWYSGLYPSAAGDVTSGYVCFDDYSDLCYYNTLILVTNCNGFYVYYLVIPPYSNLRFCTI